MALPRLSFGKRFIAIYGAVFIAVLLIIDGTLTHFLEKHDFNQLQDSLVHQSILLRELIQPEFQAGNTFDVSKGTLPVSAKLQPLVQKLSRETRIRITLINSAGLVLADSSEDPKSLSHMDNHATRPEIVAALKKEIGTSIRYSMTLDSRMLYVAIPVLQGPKVIGVIRTAMPLQQVDRLLNSMRQPIATATILGILFIVLIGILFGNHINQRIRKITSVAQKFAEGDFSERVLVDGQDEFKLLAGTMNSMAQALRTRMEELKSEKEKAAVILQNMFDGVLAVNHRRQILIANSSAETMFGLPGGPIIGKTILEVTRNPQINALLERAWESGSPVSEEIILLGKTKRFLQTSAIKIQDPRQEISGILVFHDITEIRRLENIRKEFVANVSHELRTPLTSLKGFIETLLGGASKDPVSAEKFLKIMEEDASRLSRLVDDLLTLNEIEQGGAILNKEPLDLQTELQTVLERFKLQIRGKNITIENRITPGPAVPIMANPDKLRQVLVNLLDNAIKFNRDGGKVVVSVKKHSQETEVSIADTGIGIPQESIGRIFERFFRVDKARSRELGGTGLGLAIVKHIMESHNGRVTCQSESGQSSIFSVFFPA